MKIDATKFFKKTNRLEKMPNYVVKKSLKAMKNATPVAGGNARNKTRLATNNRLKADYPYAGVLDAGYSRQAPDGFTNPTIEYMDDLIADYVERTNG